VRPLYGEVREYAKKSLPTRPAVPFPDCYWLILLLVKMLPYVFLDCLFPLPAKSWQGEKEVIRECAGKRRLQSSRSAVINLHGTEKACREHESRE
jgi:hypothetical protein